MGANGSGSGGGTNDSLLERVLASTNASTNAATISQGYDNSNGSINSSKRALGAEAPTFRFERAHDAAFEKMESIADHWSVKQARQRTTDSQPVAVGSSGIRFTGVHDSISQGSIHGGGS